MYRSYFCWTAGTRGLFEYRRGNAREAVNWLRKGLKANEVRGYAPIYTRLTLAMALARLGEAEQARLELAEAQRALDSNFPKPGSGELNHEHDWHDTLTCWVLRAEAEKVVAESSGITAGEENGSKTP